MYSVSNKRKNWQIAYEGLSPIEMQAHFERIIMEKASKYVYNVTDRNNFIQFKVK